MHKKEYLTVVKTLSTHWQKFDISFLGFVLNVYTELKSCFPISKGVSCNWFYGRFRASSFGTFRFR